MQRVRKWHQAWRQKIKLPDQVSALAEQLLAVEGRDGLVTKEQLRAYTKSHKCESQYDSMVAMLGAVNKLFTAWGYAKPLSAEEQVQVDAADISISEPEPQQVPFKEQEKPGDDNQSR